MIRLSSWMDEKCTIVLIKKVELSKERFPLLIGQFVGKSWFYCIIIYPYIFDVCVFMSKLQTSNIRIKYMSRFQIK